MEICLFRFKIHVHYSRPRGWGTNAQQEENRNARQAQLIGLTALGLARSS